MYLIIPVILFALLNSYKEGMIFIQYKDIMFTDFSNMSEMGVRSHKYFGIYHLLSLIILASYSIILYLVLLNTPSILMGIGLLILYWEIFEIGYAYSRYAKPVVFYEHIVMLDAYSIQLRGWQVLFLHIARFVSASVFIIYGQLA